MTTRMLWYINIVHVFVRLKNIFHSFHFTPIQQAYVVDSSDGRRLEEAQYELDQLLKEPKLKGVPLLIFANKQDLISSVDEAEVGTAMGVSKMTRDVRVQACSAKTGDGLEDGMAW